MVNDLGIVLESAETVNLVIERSASLLINQRKSELRLPDLLYLLLRSYGHQLEVKISEPKKSRLSRS